MYTSESRILLFVLVNVKGINPVCEGGVEGLHPPAFSAAIPLSPKQKNIIGFI